MHVTDAASMDRAHPADEATQRVVRSTLSALRKWDAQTYLHSLAVGEWASRLAAALGRSEREASFARFCGELHDLGKLLVPAATLRKPGPLEPHEWPALHDHPTAGARMVRRNPQLEAFSATIEAHHERLDGSGYPHGLRGDDIPMVARIVAVADAFHVMIEGRPYRAAVAPRIALAELAAEAGTLWDAQVVAALQGLIEGSLRTGAAPARRRSAYSPP